MEESIKSAELLQRKMEDRGFVRYSMILHDHVSKTLTMLKDDENEDDVDDDETDEEEKRSPEKKVSGKDVIEESRQALLKTRAMSTQNLDPESVTSATISEVVDVWLVDVYKSEYMKVADVVKNSVVKHLNRRRQQLNQEIVPRALEKAAEMMKERFEKDCRKPLEDLNSHSFRPRNLRRNNRSKRQHRRRKRKQTIIRAIEQKL